jgi:hypothetical protein
MCGTKQDAAHLDSNANLKKSVGKFYAFETLQRLVFSIETPYHLP